MWDIILVTFTILLCTIINSLSTMTSSIFMWFGCCFRWTSTRSVSVERRSSSGDDLTWNWICSCTLNLSLLIVCCHQNKRSVELLQLEMKEQQQRDDTREETLTDKLQSLRNELNAMKPRIPHKDGDVAITGRRFYSIWRVSVVVLANAAVIGAGLWIGIWRGNWHIGQHFIG